MLDFTNSPARFRPISTTIPRKLGCLIVQMVLYLFKQAFLLILLLVYTNYRLELRAARYNDECSKRLADNTVMSTSQTTQTMKRKVKSASGIDSIR